MGTDSTVEPPQGMQDNKYAAKLVIICHSGSWKCGQGENVSIVLEVVTISSLYQKGCLLYGILIKTVEHKDTQCLCCQEKQKHSHEF